MAEKGLAPDIWSKESVSSQAVGSASLKVLWVSDLGMFKRKSFEIVEEAGVSLPTLSVEYNNKSIDSTAPWASTPAGTFSLDASSSVIATSEAQVHYWRIVGRNTGSDTSTVSVYVSLNTR